MDESVLVDTNLTLMRRTYRRLTSYIMNTRSIKPVDKAGDEFTFIIDAEEIDVINSLWLDNCRGEVRELEISLIKADDFVEEGWPDESSIAKYSGEFLESYSNIQAFPAVRDNMGLLADQERNQTVPTRTLVRLPMQTDFNLIHLDCFKLKLRVVCACARPPEILIRGFKMRCERERQLAQTCEIESKFNETKTLRTRLEEGHNEIPIGDFNKEYIAYIAINVQHDTTLHGYVSQGDEQHLHFSDRINDTYQFRTPPGFYLLDPHMNFATSLANDNQPYSFFRVSEDGKIIIEASGPTEAILTLTTFNQIGFKHHPYMDGRERYYAWKMFDKGVRFLPPWINREAMEREALERQDIERDVLQDLEREEQQDMHQAILEAMEREREEVRGVPEETDARKITLYFKPILAELQRREKDDATPVYESDICTIGFDPIAEGEYFYRCKRCNKPFKYDNFQRWLAQRHSCPHCRLDFTDMPQLYIQRKTVSQRLFEIFCTSYRE
jgi:hypothetical protein